MEATHEVDPNPQRPRSVATAVQLLTASLAVGVLRSILNLWETTSGAPMLFALIVVIAFFSLLLFVVMKISAGRNWARILVLVCVLILILLIPFSIPTFLQQIRRNVLFGILGIIITLLQLVGTALLFTKQSNLWFKSRK